MNEVNKLVEWVARELCKQDNYGRDCWNKESRDNQNIYKKRAKQILSHPDLWVKIDEGDEEWVCNSEGVKHKVRIPITIPLAEAIKEVNNEMP